MDWETDSIWRDFMVVKMILRISDKNNYLLIDTGQ